MRTLSVLCFVWFSITFHTHAQSALVQDFAVGVQNRNLQAVLKTFGETIEINIEGTRQVLSRNQSEGVLNDFFDKHPLRKFELQHSGSSGSAEYAIARYQSNNGDYRVKLKINAGTIAKLEFTKE